MKRPQPPSMDVLLEAMHTAMAADSQRGTDIPAVSVRELMTVSGRNQEMVRDWLRAGIAEGRVEIVRVKRQALDGRLSTVSAYRLKNGKKPK